MLSAVALEAFAEHWVFARLLFNYLLMQAVVRPWRLSNVVHELSRSGVLGMTAYPVRGVGIQAGDARACSELLCLNL